MSTKASLRSLVLAGILAAAITAMTLLIHMPVGSNGGYIHFGDALIYFTAALLPTPYAMAAAAIGGGLADLLSAPAWVLPTVLIKALLVLPFTCSGHRLVSARNVVATCIAGAITVAGYFVAEGILFGGWTALLVSLSGNLMQAVGSAVLFLVLGTALDTGHLKARMFRREGEK